MVELERKEVKTTSEFDRDIQDVFLYGEETFGYSAAKIFVGDIFNYVWNLDKMYLIHPECRHLETKQKIYRNIIRGSYLVIYRITSKRIEVLRVISGKMSVSKIKAIRSIKL